MCIRDSLDALRLITHLKFLAQRIQQNSIWKDGEEDSLYAYLLGRDPRNPVCLERMDEYLRQHAAPALNRQEQFYLLIHLNRVLEKE